MIPFSTSGVNLATWIALYSQIIQKIRSSHKNNVFFRAEFRVVIYFTTVWDSKLYFQHPNYASFQHDGKVFSIGQRLFCNRLSDSDKSHLFFRQMVLLRVSFCQFFLIFWHFWNIWHRVNFELLSFKSFQPWLIRYDSWVLSHTLWFIEYAKTFLVFDMLVKSVLIGESMLAFITSDRPMRTFWYSKTGNLVRTMWFSDMF